MESAKKRIGKNIGRLHAVKCEWCGLKIACNCWFDDCRDKPTEPHPVVLCARCQVTDFMNLLFGRKSRKRGTATPDS